MPVTVETTTTQPDFYSGISNYLGNIVSWASNNPVVVLIALIIIAWIYFNRPRDEKYKSIDYIKQWVEEEKAAASLNKTRFKRLYRGEEFLGNLVSVHDLKAKVVTEAFVKDDKGKDVIKETAEEIPITVVVFQEAIKIPIIKVYISLPFIHKEQILKYSTGIEYRMDNGFIKLPYDCVLNDYLDHIIVEYQSKGVRSFVDSTFEKKLHRKAINVLANNMNKIESYDAEHSHSEAIKKLEIDAKRAEKESKQSSPW